MKSSIFLNIIPLHRNNADIISDCCYESLFFLPGTYRQYRERLGLLANLANHRHLLLRGILFHREFQAALCKKIHGKFNKRLSQIIFIFCYKRSHQERKKLRISPRHEMTEGYCGHSAFNVRIQLTHSSWDSIESTFTFVSFESWSAI